MGRILQALWVEVKDPLKQGLKLMISANDILMPKLVEVKDPLKQGLKLYTILMFLLFAI